MEGVLLGLASMPAAGMPAVKRPRTTAPSNGQMVSSSLVLNEPHDTENLSAVAKQRAVAEARSIVHSVDKVLEKMLEVRVISTHRDGKIHNHVNLRIASEFSTMVHHERAQSVFEDVMFCFMASNELEPVVVVVLLHGDEGRVVKLGIQHFVLLETALNQFRIKFGLKGETYSYTTLKARLGCSWHSRHFHLKIRVPTEMYLRVFPAMQVLGSNHACKRNVLDAYKHMWEPLKYKFDLKTQQTWAKTRQVVLQDVVGENTE
jgi:hypothetical protein